MADDEAFPPRDTLTFGELVAAVFEQALELTRDPREAARVASVVVEQLLEMTGHGPFVARLAAN